MYYVSIFPTNIYYKLTIDGSIYYYLITASNTNKSN